MSRQTIITTTTIKEYDEKGRLVKETTTVSEYDWPTGLTSTPTYPTPTYPTPNVWWSSPIAGTGGATTINCS